MFWGTHGQHIWKKSNLMLRCCTEVRHTDTHVQLTKSCLFKPMCVRLLLLFCKVSRPVPANALIFSELPEHKTLWQAKPMAIWLPHMPHFIVSRKHVNAGEQSSLIQIVQLTLQHTFLIRCVVITLSTLRNCGNFKASIGFQYNSIYCIYNSMGIVTQI